MKIRTTRKAFNKVAAIMQKTMKRIIKSNLNPSMSKFRSGNLVKNLAISTKQDKEKGLFSFIVKFPFYGMFFDSGVRGSRKPIGKRKYSGKQATPNSDSFYDMGKFKSKTIGASSNLPFPLKANVAYFGLTPKPFVNPGLQEGIDQAAKQLGPDMAEQVINAVKGIKDITIG